MRLNFSYSDNEAIIEGIRRLGEVIKEELAISYEEEPFLPDGV
jgi:DNA-binding transcriptional MocR family regulator